MAQNIFEKKALFGMGAIMLFVSASVFEIGRRNLWFEIKNHYHTYVKDADGLRIGSLVTMSGLRIGEVVDLSVDENNRIRVAMAVQQKIAPRLRRDSVASTVRLFIIGEKRIDLSPGTASEPILEDGAELPGKELADLAEFMSGRKLAELMAQVELLITSLNNAVGGMNEMFGRYKGGEFNSLIAKVEPVLGNVEKLTEDLTAITGELKNSSKSVPLIVDGSASVLQSLRKDILQNGLLRDTLSGMKQDLFANGLLRQTLLNVNDVTRPMAGMIGPMAKRKDLVEALAQNLENALLDLRDEPHFAKKLVTTLDELIITLRAAQRTWLLEDQAEEERAAEQSRQKTKKKAPPQGQP